MPHDLQDRELSVGDRVMVECVVLAVHATEDYCNVDLETAEPMRPSTCKTHLVLNAKQVTKTCP